MIRIDQLVLRETNSKQEIGNTISNWHHGDENWREYETIFFELTGAPW